MRITINYRGSSILQKDTDLESDAAQERILQGYVHFFVNKVLCTTTLLI